MITLITGTPGAGKTAWIVQEITRLPTQRKIYVHGIPDLKIAHEAVYCKSNQCDHCRTFTVEDKDGHLYLEGQKGGPLPLVENWQEWATHGSLLILDEIQRVWRPRAAGSIIPPSVAQLETHRHKGLDFWIVSQGPHLFDSNVRLLVGRHIHLVANWAGRYEYEWPECRQDVSRRNDAVKRPYKLPKQIFSKYKSASLHTKLEKRKPMLFYVLIASVFLMSGLGYKVYKSVNTKISSGDVMASKPNQKIHDLPIDTPVTGSALAGTGAGGAMDSLPDFKPEIEGKPETAPAYRHLLKVTAIPFLAGCIKSANSCKCYTQQATPYPVTWEQCLENVANLKFNPYASTVMRTPTTPQAAGTSAQIAPHASVLPVPDKTG